MRLFEDAQALADKPYSTLHHCGLLFNFFLRSEGSTDADATIPGGCERMRADSVRIRRVDTHLPIGGYSSCGHASADAGQMRTDSACIYQQSNNTVFDLVQFRVSFLTETYTKSSEQMISLSVCSDNYFHRIRTHTPCRVSRLLG